MLVVVGLQVDLGRSSLLDSGDRGSDFGLGVPLLDRVEATVGSIRCEQRSVLLGFPFGYGNSLLRGVAGGGFGPNRGLAGGVRLFDSVDAGSRAGLGG